jgi:hypothetical protein
MVLGYDSPKRSARYANMYCDDFDCAMKYLSDAKQTHPVYYAVAGLEPNEGAVIVKDRFGPAHIDKLSDERWYIFLANEDHYLGQCNTRCVEGNKYL